MNHISGMVKQGILQTTFTTVNTSATFCSCMRHAEVASESRCCHFSQAPFFRTDAGTHYVQWQVLVIRLEDMAFLLASS